MIAGLLFGFFSPLFSLKRTLKAASMERWRTYTEMGSKLGDGHLDRVSRWCVFISENDLDCGCAVGVKKLTLLGYYKCGHNIGALIHLIGVVFVKVFLFYPVYEACKRYERPNGEDGGLAAQDGNLEDPQIEEAELNNTGLFAGLDQGDLRVEPPASAPSSAGSYKPPQGFEPSPSHLPEAAPPAKEGDASNNTDPPLLPKREEDVIFFG